MFNQSFGDVNICQFNTFSRRRSFETILKGEMYFDKRPQFSNDVIGEKLINKVPVIIRKNVSKNF